MIFGDFQFDQFDPFVENSIIMGQGSFYPLYTISLKKRFLS